MVEHVKLEIAIQICAEKINDIFEKIDATDDDYLRRVYEQELILAFDEKDSHFPEPTACIRCGACVNHCPFGINPYAIANAFKVADLDETERLGVNLCMECGCCSFICPANRPLVQTNRLAKAALRKRAAENKKEEKK